MAIDFAKINAIINSMPKTGSSGLPYSSSRGISAANLDAIIAGAKAAKGGN